MFIKLGDYIISVDEINLIQMFPSGVKVLTKFQQEPIKIVGISDLELQIALDKLFLRRKDVQ